MVDDDEVDAIGCVNSGFVSEGPGSATSFDLAGVVSSAFPISPLEAPKVRSLAPVPFPIPNPIIAKPACVPFNMALDIELDDEVFLLFREKVLNPCGRL